MKGSRRFTSVTISIPPAVAGGNDADLIIDNFTFGGRVRWPYEIKMNGHVIEQIDGAVEAAGLHCLIESKDEQDPLAIAPVAKMRNQLMRRPAATVGLIFSTSGYTAPAQVLAGYLGSQTILFWHPRGDQAGCRERTDRFTAGSQVSGPRGGRHPRRQHGFLGVL